MKMTTEDLKLLKSYPENYAPFHELEMTKHLSKKERDMICECFVDFINCIPDSWEPELKVRFLYSLITRLVEYDYSSNDDYFNPKYSYIGVLKKKSVCIGIAEWFTLVLNNLGVKTITIIGKGSKEPHAWNIVWLPNTKGGVSPFHFDATWDLGHDYPNYTYYLKNDSYMISKNHIWLANRYPVSNDSPRISDAVVSEELIRFGCDVYNKFFSC